MQSVLPGQNFNMILVRMKRIVSDLNKGKQSGDKQKDRYEDTEITDALSFEIGEKGFGTLGEKR
jgi:hypothetical protein